MMEIVSTHTIDSKSPKTGNFSLLDIANSKVHLGFSHSKDTKFVPLITDSWQTSLLL
jgi:hypothetical protein